MSKLTDLDDLFIEFCEEVGLGDQVAHLIDTDNNAGEEFREKIKKLFLDIADRTIKDHESFKAFKQEVNEL